MFKSLKDYNLTNKRVLVRCDFNVPIKDDKVLDDFRIQKVLPTIVYLKKAGAKIILLSHLGRPRKVQGSKATLWGVRQGASSKVQSFTLKPVALKLKELLREEVKFLDKCIGRKAKKQTRELKAGEILLLENLRLEKGEWVNDENFAKSLAELGEFYVGEAFGVCHRVHASVVGLPRFLPHVAGLELEKEIRVLSEISRRPARPLVVVIGGSKISSKIKVIEKFLETADCLLFGGKIANIILRVKGICVGRPWPEEEIVKKIEKLNLTNPKIHLPIDVLASPDKTGNVYVRETGPGNIRKEEKIFDIGPDTIYSFSEIVKTAQTLFWSGPMGLGQNGKFSKGTEDLARSIVRNYSACKVVGGGDTTAILRKLNLLDKFSFVSTGGGAMLSFLAGEKLPGIEALKE